MNPQSLQDLIAMVIAGNAPASADAVGGRSLPMAAPPSSSAPLMAGLASIGQDLSQRLGRFQPQVPQVPQVSQIPQVSQVSQISQPSQVPQAPQMQASQAPQTRVPQVPQMQIPRMPQVQRMQPPQQPMHHRQGWRFHNEVDVQTFADASPLVMTANEASTLMVRLKTMCGSEYRLPMSILRPIRNLFTGILQAQNRQQHPITAWLDEKQADRDDAILHVDVNDRSFRSILAYLRGNRDMLHDMTDEDRILLRHEAVRLGADMLVADLDWFMNPLAGREAEIREQAMTAASMLEFGVMLGPSLPFVRDVPYLVELLRQMREGLEVCGQIGNMDGRSATEQLAFYIEQIATCRELQSICRPAQMPSIANGSASYVGPRRAPSIFPILFKMINSFIAHGALHHYSASEHPRPGPVDDAPIDAAEAAAPPEPRSPAAATAVNAATTVNAATAVNAATNIVRNLEGCGADPKAHPNQPD